MSDKKTATRVETEESEMDSINDIIRAHENVHNTILDFTSFSLFIITAIILLFLLTLPTCSLCTNINPKGIEFQNGALLLKQDSTYFTKGMLILDVKLTDTNILRFMTHFLRTQKDYVTNIREEMNKQGQANGYPRIPPHKIYSINNNDFTRQEKRNFTSFSIDIQNLLLNSLSMANHLYMRLSRISKLHCNRYIYEKEQADEIQEEADEIQKELKYLHNHGSRSKRGLINVGGSLLHELFGVSTDHDLHKLRQRLGNKIRKHSHRIETLKLVSDSLLSRIYLLERANRQFRLSNKVRDWNLANKIVTEGTLNEMLFELLNTCTAYDKIYLDAKLGNFNLDLIDKNKLKTQISQLQLKWALTLPISIDDPQFDKILDVKILTNNKISTIIIGIPFIDNESYETTIIHPFPMYVNNIEEYKISIDITNTVVIKSTYQNKIMLTNSGFLKKCKLPYDNKRICPNLLTIHIENKNKRDNCEINLVQYNITDNCTYKKENLMETRICNYNNSIILTGIKHESITVSCEDTKTNIKLSNSGLAIFPDMCTIKGNSFTYEPLKTQHIDTNTFKPYNIYRAISKESVNNIELLNTNRGTKNSTEQEEDSYYYYDEDEEEDNLIAIEKPNILTTIIGTVLLICIIVLVTKFIIKRRSKRRTRVDNNDIHWVQTYVKPNESKRNSRIEKSYETPEADNTPQQSVKPKFPLNEISKRITPSSNHMIPLYANVHTETKKRNNPNPNEQQYMVMKLTDRDNQTQTSVENINTINIELDNISQAPTIGLEENIYESLNGTETI